MSLVDSSQLAGGLGGSGLSEGQPAVDWSQRLARSRGAKMRGFGVKCGGVRCGGSGAIEVRELLL